MKRLGMWLLSMVLVFCIAGFAAAEQVAPPVEDAGNLVLGAAPAEERAIPLMAEAASSSSISINKTNFPSSAFRSYVGDHFDSNNDGKLSPSEMKAVTEIRVRSIEEYYAGENPVTCTSLKGIEHFPNLSILECCGTGLSRIDVRANTRLTQLLVTDNKLKTLDVSRNKRLSLLNCNSNSLKTLDVSNNTKLVELYCSRNRLTTLSLTKNTKLIEMRCDNNKISTLDVSRSKALIVLDCRGNRLKALDISNNKKLKELWCGGNSLKKLNVSGNTRLEVLTCGENKLSALDVSKNKQLIALDCWSNPIASLKLSSNKKLECLSCDETKIKTLDIGKCPELIELVNTVKPEVDDTVINWEGEPRHWERWQMFTPNGVRLTAGKKVLYESGNT